jgi:hypothetical protein
MRVKLWGNPWGGGGAVQQPDRPLHVQNERLCCVGRVLES